MSAEPERRLSEALRAQASGAGMGARPRFAPSARPARLGPPLLIALAAGVLLGVVLALVTLLAPGVL